MIFSFSLNLSQFKGLPRMNWPIWGDNARKINCCSYLFWHRVPKCANSGFMLKKDIEIWIITDNAYDPVCGFHPLMVLLLLCLLLKQLGVNIAQAIDCRDFVRRKTEEEASRAAKRRKKEIAWGYDSLVTECPFLFAIASTTLSRTFKLPFCFCVAGLRPKNVGKPKATWASCDRRRVVDIHLLYTLCLFKIGGYFLC